MSLACRRHRYSESLGSLRSRFLEEVPLEFFEESSAESIGDILHTSDEFLAADSSLNFRDEMYAVPSLEVGQWVIHPSFGRGRILDKDGRGENLKVTILFDHNVRKKIMVKYANLQLS